MFRQLRIASKQIPQGGTGLQVPQFTTTTRKEENMNKGRVKFFNTNKGFGFITQNEGGDLFFHVSELKTGTASEGDKVEYDISEGRKGPCAVNIREAYSF